MRRHDVICCGVAALDFLWRVETLPVGDSKVRGLGHVQLIGGLAANAAIAVARLGGSVALWARAGEDDAGRRMHAEAVAHGIDVDHFRLFAGAQSISAGIFVDAAGSRMIVSHKGGPWPDETDWLPLDAVSTTGAVHADTRWPRATRVLFEAARSAGVPTVLDIELTDPAELLPLLPLTDHAIFSQAGFRGLVGDLPIAEGLARVASAGARVPVVTLAGDGVAWFANGTIHRQHAFRVEVVDTTGAGDVFHGAYALAIAEGVDLVHAVRFAQATAALKCTRFGGGSGSPDRDEVERLLADQPDQGA